MPEYEYSALVETATILFDEDTVSQLNTDNTSRGVIAGLGPVMVKVTEAIKLLPNGPWEIVSHNVQAKGNKSILTFVIRAER
jgi:hypothetical protein